MMKDKGIFLIAMLFAITMTIICSSAFANAAVGIGTNVYGTKESIGPFKVGNCVELPQIANASYCNITAIYYPNGSFAITTPINMTKTGTSFNATFCDTSATGEYRVNGECDTDVWVYAFEVTRTGISIGVSESIIYFIILLITIILIAIILVMLLNSKSVIDQDTGEKIDSKIVRKLSLGSALYLLIVWLVFIMLRLSEMLPINGLDSILGVILTALIIGLFPYFIIAVLLLFGELRKYLEHVEKS